MQSLPLYQKVDSIVNFEDKFALVKKHGDSLYTLLDTNIRPIAENVFFLYNSATNQITSYIKVITTKHQTITDYVNTTYSKVQVSVSDNWLRLDFDNDGSVSVDDLKKSMFGLYEFLQNFDVIEQTTTIKGSLYKQAIAYMQNELEEEEKIKNMRKEGQSSSLVEEEPSDKPKNKID